MSTSDRVRVRRKQTPWRRLMRPVRRLTRVSRLRAAIVVGMVLAAAGGATALVLVLSGAPPHAAPVATTAPLAVDAHGLHAVPPVASPGVPLTVRLIVPTAGIDIQVLQGDGVSVPLNAALHYPNTDQPGGGSNALYYAHARPGMFQGLYQVHKDDLIRALRSDGTEADYHIAALQYVAYNDGSVLKPTPYDEITLLTCTSYDPHTPRFIVIGLPGAPI